MKFRGKEKAKGITLIALIVSIIIMLILAGVSINAIVGDNGIVTKSMEASFKSAMSQYLEETNTYVLNKRVESGDLDSVYYAGDTTLNTIYRQVYEELYVLSGSKISSANITDVTSIESDEYKTHLGVEANDLTWYTDDGEANEVQWCLDLGIKVYVEGYGYMDSDGEYVIYSDGTYGKHGDTWMNEPDLSGFSTGNTYYVVYNSDNQTTSNLTADYKIYNDVPTGWYDYSTGGTSRWANIVTVANQHISYWVWIPRYVYKVTNTSNVSAEATDIRFVNIKNQWTDKDGNTHEYSELQSDGYQLASAFTFGDTVTAGIWVSKYEISDPKEPIGFSVQANENSITIYSITWDGESTCEDETLASQVEKATVEISYSGGGQNGTIKHTLPYTIEGLGSGVTYNLKVTTPTYGIDPLTLTKSVTTLEGSVEDLTAPDMSGFNSSNTYYADFSSSTDKKPEAKIGEAITISDKADSFGKYTATNVPTTTETTTSGTTDTTSTGTTTSTTTTKNAWYDYNSQKWANVFTINHETGQAAYWVWIPRYEYYVDTEMNICDIIFVSKNITNEGDSNGEHKVANGYKIPTAFTTTDSSGNTIELSGIWVMKYEITDIMVPSGIECTVTSDTIEISNLTYTDGNGYSASGKSMPNTAVVSCTGGTISGDTDDNGRFKIGSVSSSTVKITGLTGGQTYTVTLVVPLAYSDDSTGTAYTKTITQSITLPTTTQSASTPDVSGFTNTPTTYAYYVYYSSPTGSYKDAHDGVKKNAIVGERITASSTPSQTWADYNNKIWANVLVTDTDLSTLSGFTLGTSTVGDIPDSINVNMFVWIPKYSYKYDSSTRSTIIAMGEVSGYNVPTAFTFGSTSLSGLWVAKYEIYDPNLVEN